MLNWLKESRFGPYAIGGGIGVVSLVYTQFILPGSGSVGRGTPMAILFSGFVLGLVSALTAAGIVLVYRTTRIINFAQTAIGAAGAALTFELIRFVDKMPFVVAFVLGILLAGLAGLAFDLVFGRRFFSAPRLVLTVVTIAAAGFLGATSQQMISRLPIFPELDDARRTQQSGFGQFRDQLPFSNFDFVIGDLEVHFGFAEVFAIFVALVFLVGLGIFFKYTRAGVAVRAMAENAERATLLGVSVGLLSSIVWTLAGLLSGASVTLNGILSSPESAAGFAPDILLPAMAAAVLGRMRRIAASASAAVLIAVLSTATNWSFPDDAALINLALLLVIGAGLLIQRKGMLRSEEGSEGSWEASEEQSPIPDQLMKIPSLRITRRVFILLGLVGAGLYPFVTSTGATNLGSVIALQTIVALSLVVLTGWAGQVSLGQFGLVAIGTVAGGSLTGRWGLNFWFAVPLATAITAGFAVLVGIPALRIKGLFLGVTTFAFAVAVHSILFSERYFGWLLPKSIARPTLFFFDFEDERSMYFLSLAALVGAIVVVTNLRKSRTGRLMIALRENETGIQSFGVSALRMKLLSFAIAGALAGFAGAIFAHQQRGLSADSFTAQASVDMFLLAVVGGVSSVSGALLGSAYFNLTRYLSESPLLVAFVGAGGTLYLLYAAPGGLISLLSAARDSVLRIIAQRRQLIVPSLFADYDPEALARRLYPMAKPLPDVGLSVLPPERFDLESKLYRRGEQNGEGAAVKNREQDLIGAATSGLDDRETLSLSELPEETMT